MTVSWLQTSERVFHGPIHSCLSKLPIKNKLYQGCILCFEGSKAGLSRAQRASDSRELMNQRPVGKSAKIVVLKRKEEKKAPHPWKKVTGTAPCLSLYMGPSGPTCSYFLLHFPFCIHPVAYTGCNTHVQGETIKCNMYNARPSQSQSCIKL